MYRRDFIKSATSAIALAVGLSGQQTVNANANSGLRRKIVYYWNLHSPPEGIDGAKDILNDLNVDFIWYAHWTTGIPMPRDLDQAYEIAKNAGYDADEFRDWCKSQFYTLSHVKEQLQTSKGRVYCPCILGYSNFRIDFNFDPITFDPIPYDTLVEMSLNFGKWGIVNPETGKEFTFEETQRLLFEYAGMEWDGKHAVFDTSSKLLIDYQVKKAEVFKNIGAQAVWFDMFFQLPKLVLKLLNLDYDHPIIKDLYSGCCEIIDSTKRNTGLFTGTWDVCLNFPYSQIPKVDFVTASPTVSEILNLKLDYTRWEQKAELILNKRKNCELVIIFDFGDRDDSPLPVFSQELSVVGQRTFLVELYKLARHLNDEMGLPTSVAYPVHGHGLGKNPRKLAWGEYKIYDAKAPEFNTYDTIKSLLDGKIPYEYTFYEVSIPVVFILLLVAVVLSFKRLFAKTYECKQKYKFFKRVK